MRLIDADALKADYFTTTPTTGTISTMYVSLYQILNAPTIEERKKGQWININGWHKCSQCGQNSAGYNTTSYCPNCGCKMEGEEDG